MKLTFWNSAKSKLADFGLGGDDFSSFSEDISDGWFVTRCSNFQTQMLLLYFRQILQRPESDFSVQALQRF